MGAPAAQDVLAAGLQVLKRTLRAATDRIIFIGSFYLRRSIFLSEKNRKKFNLVLNEFEGEK
jgi:hypothetical protein